MPSYTVDEIIEHIPNDYAGLDRTIFTTGGSTVYMFHKPENSPEPGTVLDGTIAYDKRQNMKFTKAKSGVWANQAPPLPPAPVTPAAQVGIPTPAGAPAMPKPTPPQVTRQPNKVYKADPDKMKQEFTLEQARNMSIQRQVALKAAVDLISLSAPYSSRGFSKIYTDMMALLSEPDWRKFQIQDDDQPTSESDDYIPTAAEVDALDGAETLDRALELAIERDTD